MKGQETERKRMIKNVLLAERKIKLCAKRKRSKVCHMFRPSSWCVSFRMRPYSVGLSSLSTIFTDQTGNAGAMVDQSRQPNADPVKSAPSPSTPPLCSYYRISSNASRRDDVRQHLIRGASVPAHQTASGTTVPVPMLPSEEGCQQKQERSSSAEAVMTQARHRGADSRTATAEAAAITSKDRTRDEAATCIQASTRGHLMRKRVATKWTAVVSEEREKVGRGQGTLSSPGEGSPSRGEEAREERGQPRRHTVSTDPDDASEIDLEGPKEPNSDDRAAAAELSALETLGSAGVKAFFDSLGLVAYVEHLRTRQPSEERKMESSTELKSERGLDGSDLAKIARAPDPDAELLAIGVSARLHRVKVMTALGIKASGDRLGVECAPCRDGNASCRIRDNSLLNDALDKSRPAVAASVAMHMVRRIRQDQEAIVNASRGLTTSKRMSKLGSLVGIHGDGETEFQTSVEIPPVLTDEHTNVDRASGDTSATKKVLGSLGECEVFSVPLQLLPELEKAFSISCRVRINNKRRPHRTGLLNLSSLSGRVGLWSDHESTPKRVTPHPVQSFTQKITVWNPNEDVTRLSTPISLRKYLSVKNFKYEKK